jgi:putative PIN family toxin of toxin-antitoxin system
MIRAVLDANILVSAILVKIGKPARVVDSSSSVNLLTSEDILIEVERVLSYQRVRRKYKLTDHEVNLYLEDLRDRFAIITVHTLVSNVSPDPDDDKILACALDGGADYVVSGDPHLLNLREYMGIKVVTPNTFLSILEAQQ